MSVAAFHPLDLLAAAVLTFGVLTIRYARRRHEGIPARDR